MLPFMLLFSKGLEILRIFAKPQKLDAHKTSTRVGIFSAKNMIAYFWRRPTNFLGSHIVGITNLNPANVTSHLVYVVWLTKHRAPCEWRMPSNRHKFC